jgi:mannose-6-phosphate isomerase-like protein (cupin superfamily)
MAARATANVTQSIPIGVPFDPAEQVVGLSRSTGEARFVARNPAGPPHRIDGYSVGAPIITQDPPHAGEMHPDGDELLFVVSGRFDVTLELDAGLPFVELRPGDGLVVPRGVWHLVTMREPGQLVHITPGPGGSHRPLPAA